MSLKTVLTIIQKLLSDFTLSKNTFDCVNLKYAYLIWWSYAGSNRGPPACKAGALPAEL